MIESTFLFLKGIGEITERAFRAHGLHTWTDFLLAREASSLSLARKQLYDDAWRTPVTSGSTTTLDLPKARPL